MSKKTLFVITEVTFTYNDETYSAEGDGGTPLHAFLDKDDAEFFLNKKTTEWLKKADLHNYGYSTQDIFREPPSILSKEEQVRFWESDDDPCELFEMLRLDARSKDELIVIASALAVKPFTLHRITVE